MDMQPTMVSQEGFPTLEDTKPRKMTLFDLEELAVNSSRGIDKIKEEVKTARQMVADVFLNNTVYREDEAKVKEAQRKLKSTKSEISKQPSTNALLEKVKDLRKELKDKKETVSTCALEYFRLSGGKAEIEKDGEKYSIVNVAKLVKRKS